MKIRWAALLLAVLLLLPAAGCAAGTERPLPQLIIGCDDYEPYNYTDEDGEPAGMDVDLAREACARMGYTPVFRRIDWNERDTLLKSGAIDCIWSCFSMDGQEHLYAWVGPYMHSRQIVAVPENSEIRTLADLEGRSVGVRVGSKAETIFLERSDGSIPAVARVFSLNTVDELATALRNDYVDAIAGYAAPARETLNNDGVAYRFLDEDLSVASLGVAFARESDAALRSVLSRTLDEMLADGTTERILKGYGVETDKALGGLSHE